MAKNLIFIDCDSTLSSIEGIDELARLRGEDTFRECENMTNRAMDGEIAIEDVYGARLNLIKPSAEECARIGQLYIETVEPTAKSFLEKLRALDWEPIIVSGGLTQVIAPFAAYLGVDRVRAVDLIFDENGGYVGFDENCPTSRMGGKMEIIEADRAALEAMRVVMVGDGSSDLETQPFVDLFIGYGGFLERPKVKAEAKAFVYRLSDIPNLLTAF
ncbi:HAD-IB family phosphatase [Pelagicoccus sp. SDUM812003]|uniref:HAD-IB family phosphatase n=1 Tax=Pelagicoccus sp. SDUM812003 TaxID=3041267 RepID=UPI00280D228E|nr:HAD-IB family phosphatase [Pelagicoccus sp. SDUM812003]MDQ8203762.1 HAD-IB family phosphatase [Pelagicoccus sp. SDUM812003]